MIFEHKKRALLLARFYMINRYRFGALLRARNHLSPTMPPDHVPAITSLIYPQYMACPLRKAALAASFAQ
jgi:hypothetical protein